MKRACLTAAGIVASTVLAFSAASAAAQDANNDAKCLLVSNAFSRSTDAKQKQVATQAGFFYLGRLRGSPAELEAVLMAQARTITPQNAAPTMNACAQAVGRRASELQRVGERLSGTVKR